MTSLRETTLAGQGCPCSTTLPTFTIDSDFGRWKVALRLQIQNKLEEAWSQFSSLFNLAPHWGWGRGESKSVAMSVGTTKNNGQNLCALSLSLWANTNQPARVYSFNFIKLLSDHSFPFLFPLYTISILPSATKNIVEKLEMANWFSSFLPALKCPYPSLMFLSFGDIHNRHQISFMWAPRVAHPLCHLQNC